RDATSAAAQTPAIPPIDESPPPSPPCNARYSSSAPASAAMTSAGAHAGTTDGCRARRTASATPATTASATNRPCAETLMRHPPTTNASTGAMRGMREQVSLRAALPDCPARRWSRRQRACNDVLRVAEVGDRRPRPEAQAFADLHHRVVGTQLAARPRVLEHDAVRILEVDRAHPLVVDDRRDLHALGDQLGAFRLERFLRLDLEGEVIEGIGEPEPAVDAGVVLHGDAGQPAGLHEGDQLAAARVEEDVADAAALGELQDVAADGGKAENALVERAGLVQVKRGEPDVRPGACGHRFRLRSSRPGQGLPLWPPRPWRRLPSSPPSSGCRERSDDRRTRRRSSSRSRPPSTRLPCRAPRAASESGRA